MAEDYRPHLLITEDDVKPFENKRQARTKDFGMDPAQHGSKLSGDLQAIVDAYTKAQGVDSLSGEGVRLFEVVLREGVLLHCGSVEVWNVGVCPLHSHIDFGVHAPSSFKGDGETC